MKGGKIAVAGIVVVVVGALATYYFIMQGVSPRLSVGNYLEYEYNFTGTFVGEMEGTARAEVIKVDGETYTVRVDYGGWTETYENLRLGEDFMAPLTMMGQAEHVADESVQTKVGTVSAARYTTMGAIPEHDDAIYVHKESKILVLRNLDGQTVMEITDTDIEWLTRA